MLLTYVCIEVGLIFTNIVDSVAINMQVCPVVDFVINLCVK